ncbi:MAG: PAS domain S-box protein [Deltaproteobacteria bacterium]|nr:PAS domain S-box protein [Deltaproteobacteria bacterium]
MNLSPRKRFILYAVCGYLVFGSLWIFISDRMLLLFTDISTISGLSTAKGIAFILLTALLLVLTLSAIPDREATESQSRYLTSQFLILADQLPRWIAYVFAAAVTLAMLFVRMRIAVSFGERPLLILFMLPVILSSVLGGFGPGLIATAIASLGIAYYCIPPLHSLRIEQSHDLFQWFMLITSGILSSYLSELLHQARRQSEERRILQEIAQEALRESEEKLQVVLKNLPVGLILLDNRGVVLDCNPYFSIIFEAQREKYLGLNLLEKMPEGPVRQNLVAAISENGIHRFEGPYTSILSGKQLYINLISVRIAPNLLIAIITDITDRKHAEEALRESEERYRTLFEYAPDGIVIADPESYYTDANTSMCRMLGYTREELIGLHAKDIVAQTEIQHIVPALNAIKAKSDYHREWQFQRKDGSVFTAEVIATMMPNGYLLGMIRDITERKRAEEKNAKLEAQLQQAQKMESVGRLAGGVAHDFNNMLGIILGHVEMALDQVDPEQPLHADLQEIQRAAERSADLTRQLLAFARKQIIAPKVLGLNETIESMLKMLRRLIGEDIDLAWLPGKKLWPVKVDPSQIDQILANLCVNARDAISGVGKVTIETKNTVFDEAYCAQHMGFTPGEYVLLAVSDDGCGMNKEILDKLFEPFFTTKEIGKGTGLGLATIYGIIKQNKGFINVYSEPGQGTTFTIYLPRHAGKAGLLQKEVSVDASKRGNETILLVEDEPVILKMTTKMLEMQGYTVLAASTPGEAIRLAEAHGSEIHLIMTDVIMPEMNGRDLVNNLLSIHPNLKRLFMSGYTANVIAHHGVLDPGVKFIQKPFSIKDLAAKIREALE